MTGKGQTDMAEEKPGRSRPGYPLDFRYHTEAELSWIRTIGREPMNVRANCCTCSCWKCSQIGHKGCGKPECAISYKPPE